MNAIPVAEAKAQFTRLLHQVETGVPVHISRRGQAVAVLISEEEYARLQRHAPASTFWDQIQAMRADPAFTPVDWTPEGLAGERAKGSGRSFSWEE